MYQWGLQITGVLCRPTEVLFKLSPALFRRRDTLQFDQSFVPFLPRETRTHLCHTSCESSAWAIAVVSPTNAPIPVRSCSLLYNSSFNLRLAFVTECKIERCDSQD